MHGSLVISPPFWLALMVRESALLRPRDAVVDDDDCSSRVLHFLRLRGTVFLHAANCFATLAFTPNGCPFLRTIPCSPNDLSDSWLVG